eukprot:11970483-Ditylum_brightwellii.AAC.1
MGDNTLTATSTEDIDDLMTFSRSSSSKRDMIRALGRFTSPTSPFFLEMVFVFLKTDAAIALPCL